MRRLTPDLLLLVSLVYAAGVLLVCLVASIARADALDDWQAQDRRNQAQLERQQDATRERQAEGQRQYERMLEQQERQEQEAFRAREDRRRDW
mgnify:CR=1 FL=1|tara:strand:+ start:456 stop:734 length:279 start_codon:yes stop_codon:yes gene_type:complete